MVGRGKGKAPVASKRQQVQQRGKDQHLVEVIAIVGHALVPGVGIMLPDAAGVVDEFGPFAIGHAIYSTTAVTRCEILNSCAKRVTGKRAILYNRQNQTTCILY
ncbi:MAG: hypothetical protein OTJ97_08355 [SAR202 cluster bacterium]|nr:hypothetical protein [SAR202 cluster bacterium]